MQSEYPNPRRIERNIGGWVCLCGVRGEGAEYLWQVSSISYYYQCVCVCVCVCPHVCSVVSDSVTPWTAAHQASLSMGFSRQEYWSGQPFLPPGHLPNPGMEPVSPVLAGGFFTTEPPGKRLLLFLEVLGILVESPG